MKSPDSDASETPPSARPALDEIFHEAEGLDAAARDEFLARACAGDPAVEQAVRNLLAASLDAAQAWDRGAMAMEARHTALASYSARPGELFGPYRIVRRIAAGGMSVVYEALRDDAEFQMRVAIKLVQQGIGNQAGVERFRSERQILAQLEHPNIARLLDGGTTGDGIPYLVMEYVDGLPVDRFATERRLSRIERLKLFLQICEAVNYAHRNLVVHRDLKPGNILVTPEGVPKLLDFGIAKLLSQQAGQTNTHALTPEYASPEQVLGRAIGIPSDIYSLGMLLFVLLAERLPYTAAGPAELMRAICEKEPVWEPRGLIQRDLESILSKALHKEPERRYSSVEQFAADISRYLGGLPVSARPDSWMYRARKFAVRRAIPLAAAFAILISIVAGSVSTLAQSRRAQRRFNEVRSLAHSFLFEVYDSINSVPGTLDARRLVASRAQQYLDTLAREDVNDPALELELAQAYLRLGDVLGRPYVSNLGDTSGALKNYRTAEALLDRAGQRNPEDRHVKEQLAEAQMSVCVILMRQKRAAESIAAARRAIEVTEELTRINPQNAAYIEQLSHAYMRLGEGQNVAAHQSRSLSDYQQTLESYRKAVEILERAGPHDEESWQKRLSSNYFYIGYALIALAERTGDRSFYSQGLDSALKGDAINRSLVQKNPTPNAIRIVAAGLDDIGGLRWNCCRDFAGAIRDLRVALEMCQNLAAKDPQNQELRRDVAGVEQSITRVLAESGRPAQALESGRDALAILEQVQRRDPTDRENAQKVAELRAQIAELAARH